MSRPKNLYEYDGYEIPEYDPSIPPEERERLKAEAQKKLDDAISRIRREYKKDVAITA